MEDLKSRVLTFIEENQSFEGILSETYPLSDDEVTCKTPPEGLQLGFKVYSSADDCVNILKSQAKRASCPLDLLAAECLAKGLVKEVLSGCHGNHQQFLDQRQNAVLSTVIKIIKNLLSEKSFNRVHFAKCLSSENRQEGQILPIEVFWRLHSCHILSFNTYLACCSFNPLSCQAIAKGLIDVCNATSLSQEERQKQESMLSVLLGVVVPLGYKEKDKEKEQKKTNLEKIAEDILQSVIDGCSKSSAGNSTEESNRLEVFEVIRRIPDIPKSTMTSFFSAQLHKLLFKSIPDSQTSFAVMNQNKWSFSALSQETRTRFQQFLYMFKPVNIMQMLSQTFSRKEVDWETTLSFLAVFLVCEENASKLIKDYTDQLLDEALTSFDVHALSTVLLVIRQSAIEGPHVFPSYLSWFKSKFGDQATSALNNKKVVQFFFQLLNDWVPYEPAHYLKVQIIKSPEVPSKLRTFVHDYIALAKTRLMDLKEPIELAGMYDHQGSVSATEGMSEQSKQQEQALKDVEKVLESYQKTGKVPGTVMEASIFRKPYFIGRFLPALLTPRKLPDTPDTTARLIKTLSKASKIPPNMLDAYQKACEKMALDHDESSSEDDSLLSDMERLNKSLKSFTLDVLHSLQHGDKSNTKYSTSSRLSLLSGHIKAMVKNSNTVLDPSIVIIDVCSPGLDPKATQIGDALLNAFCRTCMAVRSVNCTAKSRFKWAVDFVAMVTSIPAVHLGLYYRLWDLLCRKGADLCLTVQHIQGLAAFLCHLNPQMTPITLALPGDTFNNDQNGRSICSFVESVFNSLPFTSFNWIDFTVRLSSAYLQHAAEAFTSVTVPTSMDDNKDNSTCLVPATLIKKLWYSAHLLSFGAHFLQLTNDSFTNTLGILNTVTSSALYQRLVKLVPKVSLVEWLTCEMMMCGQDDFLSEADRHQYHEVTVMGHFVPMSLEDGGCGGDYKTACSIILDQILDNKLKSYCTSSIHTSNCVSDTSRKQENMEKRDTTDIVHLLERITQLLPHNPQDTQPPWILDQYHKRIEKLRKERGEDTSDGLPLDVMIENETRSFSWVMLHLPAYLLFCDNKEVTPSSTSILGVASFVNDALRIHSGYLCCIPLAVTVHLLKYLLSISQPKTHTSSMQMSVLHQFCKDCPIFFNSLEYYWDQISITVSSLCCGAYPSVLSEAKALRDWTMSLCSESDATLSTPPHPPYIIAASIFLVICKCDSSNRVIPRLVEITEDHSYVTKILVCLFRCVVSSLMETLVQGHEISENTEMNHVAKELLEMCPQVILVFENERRHLYSEDLDSLRTLIVPNKYSKLLPLAFFTLLLECKEVSIHKLREIKEFASVTLRNYQELSKLRESCLGNRTFGSCEKPFQLDFSRKVKCFMNKYIGNV